MTIPASELKKMTTYGVDTSPGRTQSINKFRRLILAITAKEKCGKTTFGLTMPKPILMLNFDRKVEQTVLDSLGIGEDDLYIREIRVNGDDAQDEHKRLWDDVKGLFLWALNDSSGIRSILVDTESEMWELIRMAYFGKLTQILPYQYTEVNAVYKNLLDGADRADKNLCLLRKMKKQYKNDTWNGKFEPAGFGKVKDVVQVNGEMYLMEDDEGEEQFTFEVVSNGLKAGMNHRTFMDWECSFPFVAAELTDTGVDEWM